MASQPFPEMETLFGQGQGRRPDGKGNVGCPVIPPSRTHPSAGRWSYRIHKHRDKKTVFRDTHEMGLPEGWIDTHMLMVVGGIQRSD